VATTTVTDAFVRDQLLDRRRRLESALTGSRPEPRVEQLLSEVDAALARMEQGTFGICEVCHESVEADRLMADPLVRYCIDHLTAVERSALERDLEMAAGLQRGLLPQPDRNHDGWEMAYTYRPLRAVSGDYLDLIADESPDRGLFFFVGDVSGKGVAASMLTAQLHAIFRTLVASRLTLPQLIGQAGRIFCESTLSPYYATLVGGRAGAGGSVELSNAGHCPALLVRGSTVERLEPSGVPLGLCMDGEYHAEKLTLDPGDVLLMYTDGLSEARNAGDEEYGEERVIETIRNRGNLSARAVVEGCLENLTNFSGGAALADDLTVMAIRRAA
jgi:phosphoserine phosphatase RsbU/P